MNAKILILTLLASAALCAGAEESHRVFTSRGGKTVEARVTDYDALRNMVTLKTPANKIVRINARGLIEADQAYLKTWQTRKVVAQPNALRVEAKRKTLSKSRSQDEGSTKETKQIAYEVTLQNMSRFTLHGLAVKYGIFYKQEDLETGDDGKNSRSRYGRELLEEVKAGSRTSFVTKPVPISKSEVKPGYTYGEGRDTQEGSMVGIWFRFFLENDPEPVRETSFPEKLTTTESWNPESEKKPDEQKQAGQVQRRVPAERPPEEAQPAEGGKAREAPNLDADELERVL